MHNINYQIIFNWTITNSCNLFCKYCNTKYYPGKTINYLQNTHLGFFLTNKIWKFILKRKRENKYINLNIDKIISVINNTGKIAKIRLLGGEPFLYRDFIELCIGLTKYHYIDVESNLSTDLVKKFADIINPGRMEDFRAAFHIEELEEKKLISRYIDNFLYCREKGFPLNAIVVVYPPMIPKILKYRKILLKEGIHLKSQPFVGYYKGKEYPSSFTEREVKDLNMDMDKISLMRNTKNQLCSAGNGFFVISLTGDISPCYQIDKNLGNINRGFDLLIKLIKCPYEKCFCDPRIMNKKLFENTISKFTEQV